MFEVCGEFACALEFCRAIPLDLLPSSVTSLDSSSVHIGGITTVFSQRTI